jgi:hypothetical protein
MPLPTTDPGTLAEIAENLKQTRGHLLGDVEALEELGNANADLLLLDVERYVRLAQFAVARAVAALETRTTTDRNLFGFVFVALGILAPPGDERYGLADAEQCGLDAIRAITEATR